jgi:predicted RNA binding protein YcfA (HicA-like mRNA interferase family)
MAMRASELKRILEGFGFEWTTATGGGSHFKIKRDGQRTVSISLHNGLKEEVSNLLLRKLARQLGLAPETLGCE